MTTTIVRPTLSPADARWAEGVLEDAAVENLKRRTVGQSILELSTRVVSAPVLVVIAMITPQSTGDLETPRDLSLLQEDPNFELLDEADHPYTPIKIAPMREYGDPTTYSDIYLQSVNERVLNGTADAKDFEDVKEHYKRKMLTSGASGLGPRSLSATEAQEFANFAARALRIGLVENPNRTGSWGSYDKDGKFKEKTRIDVGEKGKSGWRGQTHMHVEGSDDHLPLTTPIPGE